LLVLLGSGALSDDYSIFRIKYSGLRMVTQSLTNRPWTCGALVSFKGSSLGGPHQIKRWCSGSSHLFFGGGSNDFIYLPRIVFHDHLSFLVFWWFCKVEVRFLMIILSLELSILGLEWLLKVWRTGLGLAAP